MAIVDDKALLDAWHSRRDGEAFRTLVSRYSGLVYATCKRVLRNDADAQDVAQECFLELARATPEIRSSLPAWLHRMATNRAINHVRRESRRSAREERYMETQQEAPGPEWKDVEPYVDEAIARLPRTQHEVIVTHFLHGETHEAIARRLGISRSAVTWRVQRGLAAVREDLRRKGITLGAAALSAGLSSAGAHAAAPTSLTTGLGKIAVAGFGQSSTSSGAASLAALGGVAIMKVKFAVPAVLVVLALGIALVSRGLNKNGDTTPESVPDMGSIPRPNTQQAATVNSAEPPSPGPASPVEAPAERVLSTITPGEIAVPAEMPLRPGEIADEEDYVSVRGVVMDMKGEPVADATVTITAPGMTEDLRDRKALVNSYTDRLMARSDPEFRFEAQTASSGLFRIDGIRFEGRAAISAQKAGYAMTRSLGYESLEIVPGQDIKDLEIVLIEGFPLVGKVVRAKTKVAIENAAVSRTNGLSAPVFTDEKGIFEMAFRDEEMVALHVITPRGQSTTFSDIQPGLDEIVEFAIPEGATLSGRITYRDGRPADDTVVRLSGTWTQYRGNADGSRTGMTSGLGFSYVAAVSSDGEYAIEKIDVGQSYTVQVQDVQGSAKSAEVDLGTFRSGATRDWSTVLDEAALVRGVVLGTVSGRPISDVHVAVYALSGEFDAGSELDANGRFELAPLAGRGNYRIYPRYLHGQAEVMDHLYGTEITVHPGEETELTLRMPDPVNAPIRIVDAVGNPIANACCITLMTSVTGSGASGYGAPYGTDSLGRFSWPGFMPGYESWYHISVSGYLFAKSTPFIGMAGEVIAEEEIVLYKDAAGTEGIVVSKETGLPFANTPLNVQVHFGKDEVKYYQSVTDDTGHFVIADGIPVGDVTFELSIRDAHNGRALRHFASPVSTETQERYITDLGRIAIATVSSSQPN